MFVPDPKTKPSPGNTLCTVPGLFSAFIVTLPKPVAGDKVMFDPAIRDKTPVFATVTLPVA